MNRKTLQGINTRSERSLNNEIKHSAIEICTLKFIILRDSKCVFVPYLQYHGIWSDLVKRHLGRNILIYFLGNPNNSKDLLKNELLCVPHYFLTKDNDPNFLIKTIIHVYVIE